MIVCSNPRDFVVQNENKIQQLSTKLSKCFSAEHVAKDVSQEMCYKFLKEKDLSSVYDPNFRGFENRPSSISTYMFSAVRNAFISNARKEALERRADFSGIDNINEEQEYAIINKEMSHEYKKILEHNEQSNSLSSDMEDFENFIIKNPRYNRKWVLKKTASSKHRIFSTLKLWSYLRMGYSHKEIASLLGVSTKMVGQALLLIREAYLKYSKA